LDARHLEFLARQPSARLQTRQRFWGVPKRGLALLLAHVMFWQPLWAQADGIVASGQGATVGAAGNGVPIVNIATPNGSGLSHSQFSDYNVGGQGVILNNATAQAQSTQLGGIIAGNANLNGTAAHDILIEVTGNNRSQLNGYTEVAGQSARVIVANPYGITCNGCGFINTPRATLTTGKPLLDPHGQLQRFQVDGGDILIDGAGINASNLDSFEVITRSARINGQIHARDFALIAGRNDVDAQTLQATAHADDGDAKPQLAIDSSALGGMYANTIKLVGTEKGVGVHMAGNMAASAGDIQIGANGHLIVGQMAARGAIDVQADSLDTQGPAYARTIDIKTVGDLRNQQSLAAQDSIRLSAGGQLTNSGVIEAGVNADNSRNAHGDVSLSARQINNASASVIASRDLTASAADMLDNRGGTLSAQRQHRVAAATLDNRSNGRVLSNDGLNVTAQQIHNTGGLINSIGAAELRAAQLDNSAGQLISNAQLTLYIDQLLNAGGLVSGWQGLSLIGMEADNRASGTLSSRYGDVSVQLGGGLLNSNAGAIVSARALTVGAVSIDNQGGFLSSGAGQTVTVGDLLDNSNGGSIDSGAGLVIHAMTLGNASGRIDVQQAFAFTGTDLDNSAGTMASNGGITLDLLGALTNLNGKLSGVGPLLITRSTSIDNRGGQLASHSLITLLTGHLDNRGGTFASNGALSASVQGQLSNGDGGLIHSRDGGIKINAGHFENSGGTLNASGLLTADVQGMLNNGNGLILSREGNLELNAAHLENSGGTLQAHTDVYLDISAQLSNHDGRINARNGATLRHGAFDNGNGGLYALGSISLIGDSFSNASGGQVAGRSIDMTLAGALINRGIIESNTTLALQAASLDNQNGQIRALSNGPGTAASRLTLSGLLDNRNGVLEFANADLETQLGDFSNDGGRLLHVGNGTLGMGTAQLLSAGGSIVSRGTLTLQGDTLVNRTALQAARLNVLASDFTQTSTGRLLATERFIGSGVDWSIGGTIASDGSFSLDLSGAYSGTGTLTSQRDFSLTAAQLTLAHNAVIAGGGDTQVTLSGLLANAGRLSSGANLTLNAGRVHNSGSLGSAAQLIVTANSLVNDQGLIFSGTDMGLRVATLNNLGGALYSLGNLRIDRDGQGTLSDSIVNSSGSIQSDGAMALLANRIDNIRTLLTVSDPGIYTALIENIRCIDTDCSGGKQNYAWRITQYQKLEVLAASAAASITAGGDLHLQGGALRNHSSTIATGGALNAQLVSLENIGIEPGETVTARTYRSARTRGPSSWFNAMRGFNEQYWKDGPRYDPAQLGGLEAGVASFIGRMQKEYADRASQTFTPLAEQTYAAVIQAAGPATVVTQNGVDNSVVRNGYSYIGAGPRTDTSTPGTQYSTQVSVNRQLAPDLAQQQVDPTALPDFTLPTGQNGLFRLSGQSATGASGAGTAGALTSSTPQPAHKYLIETNPLVTNLKQFLSSDHLLANLGHTRDDTPKRLGDGFYEQRLIQQAVLARTGQRFLEGTTSDEAMFRHLMNNAIASQQALNLTLGTRLSAEQIAALTHDIVWMENTQVNGETVLAPVLYLAHANHRLGPNGALIQARDLTLVTGTGLINQGTLRASNHLAVHAGDSVVNLGLMEADNRLDLLARNHVINRAGGIINGRDVNITAVNGDVLNERSVTTHQSSSGYLTEQTSFVDAPARVEVRGDLAIDTGRDFNNIGGVLDSAGDIAVKADNDVNIVAAQQVDSNARHGSTSQTIKQHGSLVTAGGGLRVDAANDAFVVGSQLHADGNLSIGAGNNLLIGSAADEQHSAGKTRKVKAQEDHVQQVASTLSGDNIDLSAGHDLTLISSHVTAANQAYLYADNDLNVLANQNSDYSLYDKKDKGSFGALKARRDEVTRITHVGSKITTGADLLLISGNDQRYQAGELVSGNDIITDSGGTTTFEAVKDLHDESHTKTNNNAFWTAAKGKGTTDETLRQTALVAQGSLALNAVKGLQIDVTDVNRQTVSQSIDAMVKADPKLAWIKDAEARGDVDWRRVKEIHESFRYNNSGLGPASQLIVAIAMAATVGPAVAGAAAGAGTVGAAATGAVAAGAAANASIGVVNHRGDLGAVFKDVTSTDAMKGYAVSALTAGAFAYADANWFAAADKAGAAAQGVAPSAASTLQVTNSAKDVFTWANAPATLARAGTRAAFSTGVSTAITGGSLRDNLVAALASEATNIAMATGFNWVGDHVRFPDGSAQKVVAHAVVGGLLAEATGSDFKTGAAAAGLNELLVNQMADVVKGNADLHLALSQVTGVLAAVAVDGDIEKGAEVAQKATTHNYLSHSQLANAAKRLASCAPDSSCYRDTLQEFNTLSMEQDVEAMANCAFAVELCKGPSLNVQNTTVRLETVKDLLADAPLEARAALQGLINSNIGFQEMLAANTAGHTVAAMVDVLQAKWGFSNVIAAAVREDIGDALKAGASIVAVRAAAKKSVAGNDVKAAGSSAGDTAKSKPTGLLEDLNGPDAPPSQLARNKAAGEAFELDKMAELKQTNSDVVQQVTVKTASGTKTRIDLMSRDAGGNIVCTECKASDTAPLTKNQKIAFPEIEKTGAVILGKGKPGFPGGAQIPPTKVDIVRP
jgi:filamentous hemagglutinin